VAGDDGAENLELGEEFLEFQHYAKALKERGVLLAVCSKNDERVAREVFLKRPEMVLKIDDFSAFIADWGDKAANLRAIAESLHIGLDALAFADDSPMERELVRRLCPEVAVVDLPEEPAEYARALDRMRLFETVSVSKEDSERAAHFQAEAARESLQRGSADLGAFLKDLEMEARACPFSEPDLERIVQLVNKTNQFNLTTKRTTEPETRALMSDPEAVTLALRLKDRFGDYGLVSVLVGRVLGESLEIETWLMSCRVLGRGLERLAFNKLLEAARSRKLKSLFGRYIPTAKNGLVKDHYRSLGFKEKGAGEWTLQVERASPLDVMISDASRDPR
jgi:FkbH-like protein